MNTEMKKAKKKSFSFGIGVGIVVGIALVLSCTFFVPFLNQQSTKKIAFIEPGIYICKHSGQLPPCTHFGLGRYNLNECGFNTFPGSHEVNSIKVIPDNEYNGVLWANGSPRAFEHDINQVDA